MSSIFSLGLPSTNWSSSPPAAQKTKIQESDQPFIQKDQTIGQEALSSLASNPLQHSKMKTEYYWEDSQITVIKDGALEKSSEGEEDSNQFLSKHYLEESLLTGQRDEEIARAESISEETDENDDDRTRTDVEEKLKIGYQNEGTLMTESAEAALKKEIIPVTEPSLVDARSLSPLLPEVEMVTRTALNVLEMEKKEIAFYTYSSSEDKIFKKLNDQLKLLIGEPQYQAIITYIKQFGFDLMSKALKTKKTQEEHIQDIDREIFFIPSGKIYLRGRQLGKGGSKTTYEVVLIGATSLELIAKDELKMRAFSLSKTGMAQTSQYEIFLNLYLKEKSKSHDLSHVNIVKSVYPVNEDQIGIMAEVYDGNVDQLLGSSKLTEETILNIVFQMAKAVGQLHQIDVVHRDLTVDNFLYQLDGQNKIGIIKITDFGASSRTAEDARANGGRFFVPWVDPAWYDKSTLSEVKFFKASDIYQLGMTFCQILAGYSFVEWIQLQKEEKDSLPKNCLDPNNPDRLYNWKMHPELWAGLAMIKSEKMRKMVRQMVDPDLNQRPTIEQVIAFLEKEIHNKQVVPKLIHSEEAD